MTDKKLKELLKDEPQWFVDYAETSLAARKMSEKMIQAGLPFVGSFNVADACGYERGTSQHENASRIALSYIEDFREKNGGVLTDESGQFFITNPR